MPPGTAYKRAHRRFSGKGKCLIGRYDYAGGKELGLIEGYICRVFSRRTKALFFLDRHPTGTVMVYSRYVDVYVL